ncbi:hypothetical protein K503DRAFT_624085 [Rhizopogon vinicolor AM-OR11-026]|uniref:Uncharacterized protein n=1 Tax=Rhizopogon vinicolor AM-OR11-026 TaxID=1314800 RepID=A0A1B7N668_9AGAM|nr:hypothetical protein K503DRAFT_624085 [Rhizopogon vinicolor AM-OR11-026]
MIASGSLYGVTHICKKPSQEGRDRRKSPEGVFRERERERERENTIESLRVTYMQETVAARVEIVEKLQRENVQLECEHYPQSRVETEETSRTFMGMPGSLKSQRTEADGVFSCKYSSVMFR